MIVCDRKRWQAASSILLQGGRHYADHIFLEFYKEFLRNFHTNSPVIIHLFYSTEFLSVLKTCVADLSPEEQGAAVLVLDKYTLALLTSALTMHELIKAGFTGMCQVSQLVPVCPVRSWDMAAIGWKRTAGSTDYRSYHAHC